MVVDLSNMSVVGLEHKVKAPTKKKKHISEEKKQLLAYGVDLADSDEDNGSKSLSFARYRSY